MSFVALLAFSISPLAVHAAVDDPVVFASNIERIRAHLEIVEQSLDSGQRETAFAHSSIAGMMASQIEESLRESDRPLANDLYLNLIDLPALVRTDVKESELLSHISDGELLLDKALVTVIPEDLRLDHSFHAQVVFVLLTGADEEYEKADEQGYDSAIAYVKRAQAIYDANIAAGPDSGFEDSFNDIIAKMQDRADFGTVTSAVSGPQREMLALAGIRDSENRVYFDAMKELLPQVAKEYGAGNHARADELAIQAYLDNYEYLEAPIAGHDEELMEAIEQMMRVELREMIRKAEPQEKIESHVQATLAKLAEAESLVSTNILAVEDASVINGHADNTLASLEETRAIGSAEDESKSEVMSQVDAIRMKLMTTLDNYEQGNYDAAFENARSAYLDSYEFIEIPLSPIDPNFTLEMEIKFAELRQLIQQKAPYEEVQAKTVELRKGLDESERLVTGPGIIAPAVAFSSSFSIIFREGLESALIIGAIVTYIEASRNEKFKKHVYYGVVLALAASAITWFIASFVITISGANRELIEAIAALSATGVLFYVSFWILNRIETKKWIEFVKAKVWQATTTGSVTVFVMLSFFTVYREGFETVLFYQAMFSFAKYMENFVVLGLVLGLASLLVVFYAIRRVGRKLPLKVLFALTMGVGAYLSIAFVGNGVRALQEADYINTTPLLGTIPRLDINIATMTGIHPTLETIMAQFALLSVYIAGMVYVLVWRARKERMVVQARKSRAEIDGAEAR